MPRPAVAKDPWRRPINQRTPTAPKGQNEIAQGRAKRRPGYGSVRVDAPRGSALSGSVRTRAHRTQGVALGYHLAPRWGKRQETGNSPHAIGSGSFQKTIRYPSSLKRRSSTVWIWLRSLMVALPQQGNGIRSKLAVCTHESHGFNFGLGNQQSVKWIRVVVW